MLAAFADGYSRRGEWEPASAKMDMDAVCADDC